MSLMLRVIQDHYAGCHYAECPYTEYRYTECRGALVQTCWAVLEERVNFGIATVNIPTFGRMNTQLHST